MSSAICKNFVQNAWKKELCSNCFKSKDEHNSTAPKPKPVTLLSASKISGIIRDPEKKKAKLHVVFRSELIQFIGYGGDDWMSGEESDNESQETDIDLSEDDLLLTDSDEEETIKEMRKKTKENTNFNTVNLTENAEKKNTHGLLMLGKPIMDSEGKKQSPLMVTVTPFGEDAPPRKFVSNKSLSTALTIQNTFDVSNNQQNNKENIVDNKNNLNNNVISNNYNKKNRDEKKKEEKSLLDEISETLENSQNPIQIMTKRSSKEVVLDIIPSNKEKKPDNKREAIYEKKVNLSRTPALKLDKPMIYQTSTAKIEILNNQNVKLNRDFNSNNLKTEKNNNNELKDENFDTKDKSDIKLVNQESAESNKVQGQTREQAGKPDGSEDPESLEIPALPSSLPPALETQNSFLHGATASVEKLNPQPTPVLVTLEKPKIPSKPSTVLIKRTINVAPVSPPQPSMSTFAKEPLSKQNSTDSDSKNNKRKAPMPPEENTVPIYTRNTQTTVNSDCPVVREKEKRERASSLAPKVHTVTSTPTLPTSTSMETNGSTAEFPPPAPAPRKLLSISSDNLCSTEDKRNKEKTKTRFSLRKFLRIGSSKDLPRLSVDLSMGESFIDEPRPKPRLVIVHPSELNGSKVEVVATPDQADSAVPIEIVPSKTTKPPPPPRNYENWRASPTNPPPKSVEILNKQRQISRTNSNTVTKKPETVYANIGEVRSSIVPNKPIRTASMREREAQLQKQDRARKHHYEPIGNLVKSADHHVYDYVNGSNRSSSPESDSSRAEGKNSPKSKNLRLNKRSESSIDVSGEYFRYGNIPRSVSLTYCGSETESEIYAPYSFYGSESEVTEDDHDWVQNSRTHKLRSRKGRSIVHKNLEDNYGAVVVANHEALAQVLENIQHTNFVQPALRGLKMCPNLRLTEFSIKSTVPPVCIGSRTFHQALWGANHVTLLISTELTTSSTLSLGTFTLQYLTEFSDLVPCELLAGVKENKKQCQATIQVLPWLQIHTIESYGELLKTKPNQEDGWRDAFFILLQVVNALKMLQAQGIEELPLSLNSFVLCKEMDRDTNFRLCVMQGLSSEITTLTNADEKYGTLCTCAGRALFLLQPPSKTTTLLQSLLSNERSVSLTQVKSVLEFSLWGPSDVSLGSNVKERELTLQRWLDLQRATVLHGLVCTRVQLTVYEESHLLFLVRSNARMMSDASMLIDSNNLKYSHSSKA